MQITYKTIDGKDIAVLSPDPTGSGGQLIQNDLKNLADLAETRQAFYLTPLLNLKAAQTVNLISIPAGHALIVDQMRVIVLSMTDIVTPAAITIGNTSDHSAYAGYASEYCSDESADCTVLIGDGPIPINGPYEPQSSDAHQTVNFVFTDHLNVPSMIVASSAVMLTVSVATAATGTACTAKVLLQGMIIPLA